jgi:hypothetical protein
VAKEKKMKLKLKPVAACSPLLLLVAAGAARADLEPFSFGASETISHDSNVNHTSDADRTASWLTTTELRAGLNQAIGRDQLKANLAADYSTYSKVQDRNSFGYQGLAEFDWSTVGDLSGSLGASSQRRQYLYGIEGETLSTSTRNLETTNRGFANIELGGLARWNLFAGFNAMNRDYSADSFKTNDERQWSTSFGTRYSTSPDLSFGLTGDYTHGEYPHYIDELGQPGSSGFSSKTLSATTRWQASGNSALDASLGYTTQTSDVQPSLDFVSGSLNYTWTPPSRFTVRLGLARSSNGGATSGTLSSLNDRSLNDTASLSVNYELTGKISLVGQAAYIKRKYSGVQLPVVLADGTTTGLETINGDNHSQRIGLYAHYKPTRTTDVNCGASHESLTADAAISRITPSYVDTTYSCAASIDFN